MAKKGKSKSSAGYLIALAFDELASIVYNAIKIDGLTAPESRFVKDCLFRIGIVGYDKITQNFAEVAAAGIDKYGEPTTATFIYRNGNSFTRTLSYDKSNSGAYIIRSTPNNYCLFDTLALTAELMSLCTRAIKQNIKACMRPNVVLVYDNDTVATLKKTIEDAEEGASTVFVKNELGKALQGIDNKTQFTADKFLQLRQAIRHEFLTQIGILTANTAKRERVQATEVYAGLDEAIDSIYAIIDNFNEQCMSYDLPFKMSFNGAAEELYYEDAETIIPQGSENV